MNKGFTLIELLVVISIISILAGASVVGVMAALDRSKVNSCQNLITNLQIALEAFETENGGEFPPVDLYYFNDKIEWAGENGGIETALLMLRQKKGGSTQAYFPLTDFSDSLGNLDSDDAPLAYQFFNITSDNNQLFELLDPWGNPIVYIPQSGTNYQDTFDYTNTNGEIIQVQATPLAKTGEYPPKYMIWSFGPDGINENGRGDDITSWKKSAEDYEPPEDFVNPDDTEDADSQPS